MEIIKYSPLEVIIEADLLNCGFLVLADTWYPGWKVFIDGKEGKIYRANYLQRAVPLKEACLVEGKHKIRFVYDPLSFKIGALISIITLLSMLIYFVGHFKRG